MRKSRPIPVAALLVCVLALALAGCSSVYYSAMEQFGVHKRDLLVKRVAEARDSQTETKEQFTSALDQFRTTLNFKGGALEEKYETLRAELDRSESSARAVRDRVNAVEDVSSALFKEWEAELNQYTDAALRRSSEQKLRETQSRYNDLIRAMRRAEDRLEPVLKPMRDQVLFLKHNLNAQAIASLQGELGTIQGNVDVLIREMESAIAEADQFIKTMDQ
jgi:hypothetical protein